MRFLVISSVACCLLAGCADDPQVAGSVPDSDAPMAEIELAILKDKIRGGWAGQMIGVSYGAPTEFRHLGRIIPEEDLPVWQPEMVKGAINQDDLYVDMTFVHVLDGSNPGRLERYLT